MHKLLARQLKRHLGVAGPEGLSALMASVAKGAAAAGVPAPEERLVAGLPALLDAVDEAYRQADRDLGLRSRSLAISNEELTEALERLRSQSGQVERGINTLREAANQMLRSSGAAELPSGGLDIDGVASLMQTLIAERESTRARLEESEAKFRSLITLISDWYWEQDAGLRFVNTPGPASGRASGVTESFIGRTPWELPGAELDGQTWDEHRAVLAARLPFRDVIMLRTDSRGRVRYLSVTGEPVCTTDGGFRGYRGVARDVTAQKQVEVELKKAKDAAESASVAKSRFLANMSHEIRTPMNGVLGMTEVLLDAGLNEVQHRYAQTIRTSAEALLHIINDILDFSKIEAGKLELDPVDVALRGKIDEAVQLFAAQADQKGLELACHVAPEVPGCVRVDPGRLRQVLLNLLGNAIKFTEAGEVTLRVGYTPSVDGTAPSGQREGEGSRAAGGGSFPAGRDRPSQKGLLRFAITDTGIGIGSDVHSRLFQPFHQADGSTTRRYGGTGLGLAVCRQLVELMGGEIGVQSEPGRGSTFWFTIRAEVVDAARSGRPRAGLGGVRILVVEDNATNRMILEQHLTTAGATCHCAVDGLAGLQAMRTAGERGEPYHIAVIDMKMPGLDGGALVRAIRESADLRSVRLVMLTSLSSGGEVAAMRAAGVDAYLIKPVQRSDLLDCLERLTGALEPEVRPDASKRPEALEFRDAHVVLAEDNPVNREIALAMLQGSGCRVSVAQNGREAVGACFDRSCDLVLMDCHMPELDGFAATREIRAREAATGGHVPIVALTANAMEGDRERCLDAGMDDYIAKPFRRNDLIAVLRRWVPDRTRSGRTGPPAAHRRESIR